jgi:hypothetical protein
MTHRVIPIPGDSTRCEDAPKLRISGGGNDAATVTVEYRASYIVPGEPQLKGQITFRDVLELRWIEDFAAYEEHPQHEHDYDCGLIEVLDSAYVEMMASKGREHVHPGKRFGLIPESDVHHYRMTFDHWGTLNVIALGVECSAVEVQQSESEGSASS